MTALMKSPADDSSVFHANSDDGKGFRTFRKAILCQLLLVGVLAVNVVILYILHYSKSNNRSSLPSRNILTSDPTGFPVGVPVALSSKGEITLAGSTFYVDESPFHTSDISRLQLLPMSDSSFVALYNSDGHTGAQVFQIEKNFLRPLKSTVSISNYRYQDYCHLGHDRFMILTATNGSVLLTIITKADMESQTVLSETSTLVTELSFSNAIGAISPSTFVVAYYEPFKKGEIYSCRLKYGRVNNDRTISLSSGSVLGRGNLYDENGFALETTFDKPVTVSEFPHSIIVPYYTTERGEANNSGLCFQFGSLDPESLDAAIHQNYCVRRYQPIYFGASAQLNKNTIAYVFYDRNNNNALTAITLTVLPSLKMTMRSEFVVNQGGGFDFGKNLPFSLQPKIEKISSSRIAVAHLDPANDAKATITVLDWVHNKIVPSAVPSVALSTGLNFSIPVTMDLVSLADNRFIVATSGAMASLALGELFPRPFGVVTDTVNGLRSVQVEGDVSSPGLVKGRYYFATTTGSLISGEPDENSQTFSTPTLKGKRTVVVAPLSRVGLAIDSDTLALLPHI